VVIMFMFSPEMKNVGDVVEKEQPRLPREWKGLRN